MPDLSEYHLGGAHQFRAVVSTGRLVATSLQRKDLVEGPVRTKLLQVLTLGIAFGTSGCGSEGTSPVANGGNAGISTTSTTGKGGAANSDNTARGGAATGGKAPTGGASSTRGGAATGGNVATGGAVSTAVNCSGPTLTGGTQVCSSKTGTLSNGVGYEVWLSSSTTGSNCGTFYGVGAAFKAAYTVNNGGDFLARAGLSWNKTQTYDQLGTIAADYAYKKSGSGGTYYIGIYGWSSNPLVEFYIVEEWSGWNPASNAQQKGSFAVDGDTYGIYTHTQTNQPSIEGTATFPQFFSIRQNTRQCGHISISEHFKKWASLGMQLGKMYEAKLLVEVMNGSGTVDFTTASVTAIK